MPIAKTFPTPNGITTLHKVVKATLEGDRFKLEVKSYPDEARSTDANLLWQEYPTVPLTAFDATDPYGSLEKALVIEQGNPFTDGVFLPEAVTSDTESLRARKWAEIKYAREQAKAAGFDVPNIGRFDSDTESRSNILGSVTAAKISKDDGLPFSIEFTLADNTDAVLDADQVIAVGFAMLEHINSVHTRGRQLRTQIEAAQTPEELAEINW